jgi:hypothetical protein
MRKRTARHTLVETASEFIGFTSRQTNNPFLVHAGVNGDYQWDGSFVDATLLKTVGQGYLPSLNNTTTAIQFFLKNGWQRRAPKPGDLVFYGYAADTGSRLGYQSPHVGVVTSTDTWKQHRTFRVIEAQTHSGQPKAPRDNNGVYERTRHETDVTAFFRIPAKYFNKGTGQSAGSTTSHIVRPSHLERCTSREKAASAKQEFRKSVETVQLALASHQGVRLQNADRGVFNSKTRAALAAFQRFSGLPSSECNGLPTVMTLELLAASPYTVERFDVSP